MNTVVKSNVPFFEELRDFPLPLTVDIKGEIDNDTVDNVSSQLDQIVCSGQPFVPVVIQSPGGNVYDSLHICDLLHACGLPIYTIGIGLVGSGAALIFTCGEKRWLAPSATFMVHDVSTDVDGSLTGLAMKTEAEEMEKLKRQVCENMSRNIGASINYFADMVHDHGNVDVYRTAQQCIADGIATDIGIPCLRVNVHVTMTLENSPLAQREPGQRLWPTKRRKAHRNARPSDDDDN